MDDETEGWGARKVRSLANKPAGDPPAAPLAHIPNLGYSIPFLRAVERYRIQYIWHHRRTPGSSRNSLGADAPELQRSPAHSPSAVQATSHWGIKGPDDELSISRSSHCGFGAFGIEALQVQDRGNDVADCARRS